jgi:hypothetical protein
MIYIMTLACCDELHRHCCCYLFFSQSFKERFQIAQWLNGQWLNEFCKCYGVEPSFAACSATSASPDPLHRWRGRNYYFLKNFLLLFGYLPVSNGVQR